jgi:DUF218 domain
MRSDQRYLVREAIRREQGEPVRREAREYDRRDEEEPPRRESREYERREYREPAPPYSDREPGRPYSDREPGRSHSVREPGPSYAAREPETYSRRETAAPYSSREPGSAYTVRESTARRPIRDRPYRRESLPAHDVTEDTALDQPAAPAWFAATRATACFLGCVTLLNLLGEMRFPRASTSGWWIDLYFLPKPASRGLLALSAVLLIAFALFPRANAFVRRLGALCTLGLLGVVGWTVYRYYHHEHAGQNPHDLPVPFTLHLAALLLVALAGQLTGWWEQSNFFKDFLIGTVTLATCAASLPLAYFFCSGQFADQGVVDAAAVIAGRLDAEKGADDKSASNPLQAACRLYRDGQVKKLLLIGRPDESGGTDETAQALRRAALAEGVAEADLLSPAPTGDSRARVAEATKLLDDQKLSHVLIVARFFEVPRIKLNFQRAGLDVHCAPIREDVRPARMHPALVREAVALWQCYVQPLLM